MNISLKSFWLSLEGAYLSGCKLVPEVFRPLFPETGASLLPSWMSSIPKPRRKSCWYRAALPSEVNNKKHELTLIPPNGCGKDVGPLSNWIFFTLEEFLQKCRVNEKAILLMCRRLVSWVYNEARDVEFRISAPNDVQLEGHNLKTFFTKWMEKKITY